MKKFFTTSFLLFTLLAGYSQELPYTFSYFNEPYEDLVSPISISGEDFWDDPNYFIEMPIDFQLFGDDVTSLSISGLGSQILINTEDPELVTTHALIPYLADIMNASITDVVSPISYKVEGEIGNQILKLEWKNVGFYYEYDELGTFSNLTNFQVWFYESDHSFEYRFGPNTIKSGDLVHIAHGAPIMILSEDISTQGATWSGFWSIAGSPLEPSIVSLTPDQFYSFEAQNQLNSEPSSGTVFRFSNYLPVNTTELEEKEERLEVWPTVANQAISVKSSKVLDYKIFDLLGKQVLTGRLNEGVNAVSIEPMPSGVYILQTSEGDQVKFMKK